MSAAMEVVVRIKRTRSAVPRITVCAQYRTRGFTEQIEAHETNLPRLIEILQGISADLDAHDETGDP